MLHRLTLNEAAQADAVTLGNGHLEEVENRRADIHGRDRRCYHGARLDSAGKAHQQWHMHRSFVEDHLGMQAMIAEHLAVVGRKNDQRVVGKAKVVELPQDLANPVINFVNHAIIFSRITICRKTLPLAVARQ